MRGGRRDVVPAPRAVWLDDRLLQHAEQPSPLGEEARLHAHLLRVRVRVRGRGRGRVGGRVRVRVRARDRVRVRVRVRAHRQQRDLRAARWWLVITPLTQPRVVTLEQAGGVRAHLVRVRGRVRVKFQAWARPRVRPRARVRARARARARARVGARVRVRVLAGAHRVRLLADEVSERAEQRRVRVPRAG